jgi:hypothetical protein
MWETGWHRHIAACNEPYCREQCRRPAVRLIALLLRIGRRLRLVDGGDG